MNAEAASLIEIIKPLKVKNGPKPPATARIQHEMTGVTPEPAFYLTVTGTGVTPLGGACQLQTASVGGTEPPPLPTCPADSVKSGDRCVDKYEGSLWNIPPAQTVLIQKVQDGTATLADLNGGGATQVGCNSAPFNHAPIPATFPADGNYTAPIYAVSIPGVVPSTCVSAIQALAACELSTKHLNASAGWVAAGRGTPDTDTDNGSTDCNTNAPGAGVNAPVSTGSRSGCVSTVGTYDMIGNVYEWTGSDIYDAAWFRGGYWGSGTGAGLFDAGQGDPGDRRSGIGFRCAR